MKYLSLLISILFLFSAQAQYVERDIKSFGAVGDGKTNDHAAFIKAAEYFNKRGGNGKLFINKGTYIVGKQIYHPNTTTVAVYEGSDVLSFKKVSNLTIEGETGSIIKYTSNLKFGAFDPATGKPFASSANFFKYNYIGFIGNAIAFIDSKNIVIKNIELNGNNDALTLGGMWGDTGYQLAHTGIHITNSTSVTVDNMKVHHFALDGMVLSNNTGGSSTADKIIISKSSFEYNGRQGLSWVGGNDLKAINSKFNHTGRGKIFSSPGAGLDIEAEVGKITNGNFINCEFVNNSGPGMVADSGNSSNCTFTACTFWGVTMWSVWVNRPAFTFIKSNFYGSVVHGYDASNDKEATKFLACLFEDKAYNGKEPYGSFLIETNYKKRMRFENCILIQHKKKLFWMETNGSLPADQKYQFKNTKFYNNDKLIPLENFKPNPFVTFSE